MECDFISLKFIYFFFILRESLNGWICFWGNGRWWWRFSLAISTKWAFQMLYKYIYRYSFRRFLCPFVSYSSSISFSFSFFVVVASARSIDNNITSVSTFLFALMKGTDFYLFIECDTHTHVARELSRYRVWSVFFPWFRQCGN